MTYIGLIIIFTGIIIFIVSESALISVKRKINKEILDDIKKMQNNKLFENEAYKNDINDFLLLIGTATFILRFIYVAFILAGIVLVIL